MKHKLITRPSDLPNLHGSTMYLDFETTSRDRTKSSVNPWRHCWLLGAAIVPDDSDTAFYVPDQLCRTGWLKDTMNSFTTWVNHNIKYDMHVIKNDLGIEFHGNVVDTVTTAKLIYSDFFSYSLANLCKVWGLPLKKGSLIHNYIGKQAKNEDFANIPLELLAEYGCGDVFSNRALHKYILERMPEESWDVYETECRLTKILFEMEQRGVRIDPEIHEKCEINGIDTGMNAIEGAWTIKIAQMLVDLQEKVCRDNAWDPLQVFEPHNSNHCYKLFCEGYGMPVLKMTEAGRPAFDKYVLKEYKAIAPDDLVEMIEEYRKAWIIKNLFVDKYNELAVDGRLHYSFNQTVRTGRMSCSEPNMQQLNKAAKRLIVPTEGHRFLSMDYAQIEFRTIIHYIQNKRALHDYEEDASTDFHQWVAEMCDIPRDPAKNINFMLGYGGGKKKTLAMLRATKELMLHGGSPEARAKQVYELYHSTLPELKETSKRAAQVVRWRAYNHSLPENEGKESQDRRGYTVNHSGRRRHLPIKLAHIAFNTLNQGSAADLMKERLVAVDDMLKADFPEVKPLLVVHDEVLFESPEDVDHERVVSACVEVLEAPAKPLRVPVRVSVGNPSSVCWADC